MPDIQAILMRLEPKALTFVTCLALVMVPVTLMVIVASITEAWRKLGTARSDAQLKLRLVERGMPADEVVRVVSARNPEDDDREAPAIACQCAVRRDDELVPALVLARGGGRYYVHFVGTDMDENEWVDAARVLLPSEEGRDAEYDAYGRPSKPAAFEQEV